MSLLFEIEIIRKIKQFLCQSKQKGRRVGVVFVRMEHEVIAERREVSLPSQLRPLNQTVSSMLLK